ncbi:oocyte zinc finger protein XlCOF7.1-like isoform X2 [Carassius auratus]|uniref:Oocyte zinc finger protein XlCOF7.1-like isoform X2 n=1 Tax=Carassius auratus TaxID=7957 RepID=A0A6P6LEW0_CARAU|nr:oocyte zinc finger protein XlCOF7.1-like isoform X2 [Carassius auratus]
MELTNDPLCEPSASEANLHNEQLSLSDRLSPSEAPLDSIVHGIEVSEGSERNRGLELKLDLYVPAPPIIEPVTLVEETVEHCALPVATEEEIPQPEAVKEGSDKTANFVGFHCKNQTSLAESSLNTVIEVRCEQASNETSSSDCTAESCMPVETINSNETPKSCANIKPLTGSTVDNANRMIIPPKKDKFNPLKIDMAKVIPLTSSQLSLQCLECHIIFSDSKSKERHLKMSHPAEYQQCMLGDALFTCYVCDQHFTTSTELMAHQRTHTGKNVRKFPCSQCAAVFKTSKAQLLHIRNKHSQESQSSAVMVPQLKPTGLALTQTANGQSQTLIMETVGQTTERMDKLDPVQIKRLIEKLGNVQKVNQLVILPSTAINATITCEFY